MRKIIITALLLSVMAWTLPREVHAEENGIKVVLKDGFYGGLVGALVGGALLAFRDHPENHIDLVAKGAAVGVIGGVVFGFYQVSQSFAEIEDGTVTVSVPTPQIVIDSDPWGSKNTQVRGNLFTWRY